MKLRAVLFDAAGTLLFPREPIGETYARIARGHGVAIPAWRLDDAFQRIWKQRDPMPFASDAAERAWWRALVRKVFRAADQMQPFADFDACFDALFAFYAQAAAWVAAPDACETLAALRGRDLRVAIASNFDHRLPAILAGLGLDRDLDLLWRAPDAGCAKPDPRFYTRACERLGVAPAAALAVGNDPDVDLEAARRAGLCAIDVASLASLGALPARIDAWEHEEKASG